MNRFLPLTGPFLSFYLNCSMARSHWAVGCCQPAAVRRCFCPAQEMAIFTPLGASQDGCWQPFWGDSPAWLVAQHTSGSSSGYLVHCAQGISKGRAAVTKGALVVKCCIIDGLSYTLPKVSFGSPYFCIFSFNLEPRRSLCTPPKLCITAWVG